MLELWAILSRKKARIKNLHNTNNCPLAELKKKKEQRLRIWVPREQEKGKKQPHIPCCTHCHTHKKKIEGETN